MKHRVVTLKWNNVSELLTVSIIRAIIALMMEVVSTCFALGSNGKTIFNPKEEESRTTLTYNITWIYYPELLISDFTRSVSTRRRVNI
jgi:hypothetical protein